MTIDRNHKVVLSLILMVTLQSCAAAPYVTSEVIERKFDHLQIGQSRQSAIAQFGAPHYTLSFPKGTDLIEVAGYDLGNFSYADHVVLFFKNGRFIGAPRSDYEIFRLLHTLQVMENAKFWRMPNDEP